MSKKLLAVYLLLGLSTVWAVQKYLDNKDVRKTSDGVERQDVPGRISTLPNRTATTALTEIVSRFFSKSNEWPEKVKVLDKSLRVEYTFNQELTEYIKRTAQKYGSDYSAIVVIDNASGELLSAVGYERKGDRFINNLAFTSTHPSASLFKIITSAGLLAKHKIAADQMFNYRGRSTTLYRYQLNNKYDRWNRLQSFDEAFAHSNNVIFGKAAINFLTGTDLLNMATRFGFNQDLMLDIPLSKSTIKIPNDEYDLAQLASGFNSETMISPVHAAVLASIVANDGVLRFPKVISKVVEDGKNDSIWYPPVKQNFVIEHKVVSDLRKMMRMTVDEGTARRSFRKMRYYLRENLDIGGKTGTITGGLPFGKRDWFTAFAVPRDAALGRGISVGVMNVNVNKWYVRSSQIAKDVIEYYYQSIFPLQQNITKLENGRKKNANEV